jgi:hypothetical protein
MVSSWRVGIGTVVTAVALSGALAVAVQADPTWSSGPDPIPAAPRTPTGGVAVGLGPVTEHAVDPAVLAAARSAARSGHGQRVTQVVRLTVTRVSEPDERQAAPPR